jgi:hypothetical protein
VPGLIPAPPDTTGISKLPLVNVPAPAPQAGEQKSRREHHFYESDIGHNRNLSISRQDARYAEKLNGGE